MSTKEESGKVSDSHHRRRRGTPTIVDLAKQAMGSTDPVEDGLMMNEVSQRRASKLHQIAAIVQCSSCGRPRPMVVSFKFCYSCGARMPAQCTEAAHGAKTSTHGSALASEQEPGKVSDSHHRRRGGTPSIADLAKQAMGSCDPVEEGIMMNEVSQRVASQQVASDSDRSAVIFLWGGEPAPRDDDCSHARNSRGFI